MERMSIKYFVNNNSLGPDRNISSVGFEEIPPNTSYPTLNHSAGYYFNPDKGRILTEYQLIYITEGEGVLETRSGGVFTIKRGMIFVLFPGEWHTYYPNYQTGWSHYWIGFCGPEVDSWMTNEYCSKESPVFKVGINDEIVSLFRKAIDVANEEPTLYQRVLSGLVTYLVALMCSIDKNLQVENDDFSSKIDYACVLMKELIDQPVSMQEIAKKAGMGYSLFRKLFKEQKNYAKVDESYKTLIDIARKANNAGLVARTYDKYILWTDSVKALTAQDELNVLKKKYDESLATIQEKDDSLSAKQYIIIGLCVLAAILAAVLIFGAIVLLRFIVLTRKQKKAIGIANEHNELKTKFIQNISAQMEPTLDTLDASLPGVKALHTFSNHIQELSELENTLSEPYEMQEKNISAFCEAIMDKIKGKTREDVSLAVNAPKLNVKINPEQLERILLHLLENAAEYTPAGGKIWLDFKKRGAHTHQFIVSDTGCGVPEEQRENIFKPFTEVKDLTLGDGLGLPICSLIATKMNGSLTLDTGYSKGARFVLELHA